MRLCGQLVSVDQPHRPTEPAATRFDGPAHTAALQGIGLKQHPTGRLDLILIKAT
ncbi:hypothetical protein T12_11434 [Trichinella patagoniensis]|uniref:Uncharacterized protein n=1 Tax=Trichinella patagoniensis TaxID=990121 RepID=A0A0V0ZT57_9BILA|nr:hypothetical protein T12_15284 [Trichinella patagoniensis]KRY15290.1 hypothetical protein T12_11434 [Trichinella patagoniensis]